MNDSPIEFFLRQLELGSQWSSLPADALSGEGRPIGQQFKLDREMVHDVLVGRCEVQLRVEAVS